MAPDQDHGARVITIMITTAMVLMVAAVPDVGEVSGIIISGRQDVHTNTRQDQMGLAPGEQAVMAPGVTGRPNPTGVQVPGRGGGEAAHARLQTGQVGLLDRGVLLHRGRHGQDVQLVLLQLA